MSRGLSMLATILGLLLIAAVGILDAAPYQELQPRAGYVPVYIREGETPLSEIHPRLAEAFHEVEHKNSEGSSSDAESKEAPSSKPNEELNASELPTEPASDESKEPNANVVEAAKEAIKELVSVFETEMLDKLGLGDNEATNESKPETEKKSEQLSGDSEKSESVSSEKPSSDVLTVEDFKAKDFNKESIKDEEVDVPEEVPADE